jgi:DNA-binding SARP family transcriptional activator
MEQCDGGSLSFRMLGPLEVWADDRQVFVGGRRQRTVLAMLLLSPDRVVSVDGLVEAVWQGHPPATARTQVAICIAGVRKTLRGVGRSDVIATRASGYLLPSDRHRIDVLEFEERLAGARAAADEGRAEDAAARYDAALALWRGPALAGLTGVQVEAHVAQLEERRLAAYEEGTAQHLRLGRHRDLIATLGAHVAANPLREQARGQLMLAQYRCGRRADSLRTFREGRDLFVDELGVEPGRDLQDLHLAILRDDPALAPPRTAGRPVAVPRVVPAQLPTDLPTFVGRHGELAELDRLLDDRDGVPAVGSVTGPPGTGKTALVVHWARRRADRFPDGQLFAEVSQPEDTTAEVLGRFLRALGHPPGAIPPGTPERVALYRSALQERRALIVLDDVSGYGQIAPLLPGSGQSRVVVAGRHPLHHLLGAHAAVPVRLPPLAGADPVRLLDLLIGRERTAADPAATVRLAALCDGLPRALAIAGARLATKPHWTVRHLVARLEDTHHRLDELAEGDHDIRTGLEGTYRRLDPAEARMYRRLALLDVPDFAVWLGAAATATGTAEAETRIERLVDEQLLQAAGPDQTGEPRYRFASLVRLHALERARQEESTAERRAALERVLDAWCALVEEARRREDGIRRPLDEPPAPLAREAGYVDTLLRDPQAWWSAEREALQAAIRQASELEHTRSATTLTGAARRHRRPQRPALSAP